jgi:plastocyanin
MGRRVTTLLIVTVAAVSAVAMASCSDDADIPSTSDVNASVPVSTATVKITSEGFDPDSATVQAGEAVTFENDDDQDHRVVADDDTFNTGTMKPGESTVVLFNEAGTVKYADALDPSRTGQIEVTPSTP